MQPGAHADPIASQSHDAFEVLPGRADAGLVLLCDHATNALPPEYGTLGLDPAQLQRHIAYDIGAAAVTRSIAAELGVPAILTRYSRLLIDPNRGEDDPTLVMRLSDGAVVPGNRHLDRTERGRRIALFHRPYHEAIGRVLDRCTATGSSPAVLAIHSFTESWKGVPRPWAASILWEKDRRLAGPLLDALWAEHDLIIGENEPYPGQYEGDTMWRHGTNRGLPHAIIEIRQDLIRDASGQRGWSDRLSRILRALPSSPELTLRLSPGAAPSPADPHMTTRSPAIPEVLMQNIDDETRVKLEAAAFRRLVEHMRQRTDVQNIDLMNLAGFCRNCLANWYQEAAGETGLPLSKDEAREIVYGMPYKEWQSKHQKEASKDQLAAFEKNKPHQH
jgi:predicted N-formylglutamate amidohydrolase